MTTISTIGIDLAKNIFQVYCEDKKGKKVLSRKLTRLQIVSFFGPLSSCLVGMEACASSLYWARVIEELGHEVKRIPAQFVTPYRRGNKTDATDAMAICEAVQRPNMRFVPTKTQEQTDVQAIHRVRSGFIQTRTATINQVRGLLAENGIVLPVGSSHVRSKLPAILDDADNGLSCLMQSMLRRLYDYCGILDEQIAEQDKLLQFKCKENEDYRRLLQIPGIGPMNATLLGSLCGHVSNFSNSRAFAAFLGLTPKENSSGGKQRLGSITKRGNAYARTLLVHGARSVIQFVMRGKTPYGGGPIEEWILRLVEQKGVNKACVALANKNARIAWKILASQTDFCKSPTLANS